MRNAHPIKQMRLNEMETFCVRNKILAKLHTTPFITAYIEIGWLVDGFGSVWIEMLAAAFFSLAPCDCSNYHVQYDLWEWWMPCGVCHICNQMIRMNRINWKWIMHILSRVFSACFRTTCKTPCVEICRTDFALLCGEWRTPRTIEYTHALGENWY